MIEHFVVDLFNNDISALKVVEKYIDIRPDKTNSFSLSERKKMAIGIVEETRKGTFSPWFYPDYSIKNIENPKVFSYKIHENKSDLIINGIDKIKENVYVLLDSKGEKIVQYFLLNKTKIVSFNLLIKEKGQASFFSY
ncbi:hypothetical protein [Flavobacterium taihuense]|uniref:Uncharacterized protein n=1 Tax=Flavobacterium taihuense TaxID=2857508 RepID=A0ABS6Y0L1_9FLAO|nr:hypothetical protein [Flavobacterium taihuense]MBW4362444.1 hypothetical protein [Flavobacterium taihuense]